MEKLFSYLSTLAATIKILDACRIPTVAVGVQNLDIPFFLSFAFVRRAKSLELCALGSEDVLIVGARGRFPMFDFVRA